MGNGHDPSRLEPDVWTGMAQASALEPMRQTCAEIHRGSRRRYIGPLQEAGYTSAIVFAEPDPTRPLQSGGVHIRYTHRVAISNSRLVSADADTVAFRWKDYRIKRGDRMKVMRVTTGEFIRRFLIHVLPDGFHRIRHYGLLASAARKRNVKTVRRLLGARPPAQAEAADTDTAPPLPLKEPCPDCGGPMRIIETFRRGERPLTRAPPRKAAA